MTYGCYTERILSDIKVRGYPGILKILLVVPFSLKTGGPLFGLRTKMRIIHLLKEFSLVYSRDQLPASLLVDNEGCWHSAQPGHETKTLNAWLNLTTLMTRHSSLAPNAR